MRKASQLYTKLNRAFLSTILLVMCCYVLYGCALAGSTVATTAVGEASLSKSRSNIHVTEDESSIKDCIFVKEVRAKSYWGGLLFQEKALEKTIADMTHEATEVGANTLLVKSKTKTFGGSNSEGVAYQCPTAEKTAVPANESLTDNPQVKSSI